MRIVLLSLAFFIVLSFAVDGDICSKYVMCNDCQQALENEGTQCYFCHGNIASNPNGICVNETNRGIETCKTGWLEFCLCPEYPTCQDCATNRGCGYCKGRGCQLGEYNPSNSSACGKENWAYAFADVSDCPNESTIGGIPKDTFIALVVIASLALCCLFPLACAECCGKRG